MKEWYTRTSWDEVCRRAAGRRKYNQWQRAMAAARQNEVLKKKTILDWLRTGQLKGRKAGRLWRIRERDLEAFLVEPDIPETVKQ